MKLSTLYNLISRTPTEAANKEVYIQVFVYDRDDNIIGTGQLMTISEVAYDAMDDVFVIRAEA